LRALRAAVDIKERDEVLLPAYTCPALVKVIQDLSLTPCPIDVVPNTLDFEVGRLRAALSERTLAVIYVHPFGIAMPVTEITEDCHSVGAVVIEDAAQAMGARYRGRYAGTWGDFGLFSMGPGKTMSTGGGGVLTVNQPQSAGMIAESWQELPAASRGQSAAAQFRLALFSVTFRPPLWWLATKLGAHSFGDQEDSWGYRKQQLSAAQSKVGRALLGQLDVINERRRQNAVALLEMVNKSAALQPTSLPFGSDPAYLRLPLLARNKQMRDSLHSAFWRAGIGAGKMYGRTLGEIFPELAHFPTPGASEVAERLLTLPTHHFMAEHDFDHIAAVLQEQG